jgi:SsrA-binding protein
VGKRKQKKEEAPPVEQFGDRLIARNRRASFNYELSERFEAGMVLAGSEVKALRQTSADLTEAYCVVRQGEVWLMGLNIPELMGAAWGHQPKRPRKLLLHRHEIEQFHRAVDRQGMTAVATRLYFRGGRAKIEIALARGKRLGDKRQTIKQRDMTREDSRIRG